MKWKDSYDGKQVENVRKQGAPPKKSVMPSLLIGLWLIVLTVVLAFMYMKTSETTGVGQKSMVVKKIPSANGASEKPADSTIQEIEKKLAQVEKRLGKLESIDQKIERLEQQTKNFETVISKFEKLESAILSAKPAEASETVELPKKTEEIKPEKAVPAETTETLIASETAPVKSDAEKSDTEKTDTEKSNAEKIVKSDTASDKSDKTVVRKAAKTRTSARKAVARKSRKKQTGSASYWSMRDPENREAAAAEYWLKRNSVYEYGDTDYSISPETAELDYSMSPELAKREAAAAKYWLKRNAVEEPADSSYSRVSEIAGRKPDVREDYSMSPELAKREAAAAKYWLKRNVVEEPAETPASPRSGWPPPSVAGNTQFREIPPADTGRQTDNAYNLKEYKEPRPDAFDNQNTDYLRTQPMGTEPDTSVPQTLANSEYNSPVTHPINEIGPRFSTTYGPPNDDAAQFGNAYGTPIYDKSRIGSANAGGGMTPYQPGGTSW